MISVGEALPRWALDRVEAEDMAVLAEVLDDPNPIHLDPDLARELGFQGLVNQGPANLSYVANMLLQAFPGGSIVEFDARLLGNVIEGDGIVAGGEVMRIDPGEGQELGIQCRVWLDREQGGRVIEGEATVRVPPGSSLPSFR